MRISSNLTKKYIVYCQFQNKNRKSFAHGFHKDFQPVNSIYSLKALNNL